MFIHFLINYFSKKYVIFRVKIEVFQVIKELCSNFELHGLLLPLLSTFEEY